MKSDENYLLYWVYNGRGNFTESMDLAIYVDDPTLILYGLLQQIEAAKNDPDLSGTKREEKIQKYEEQLNEYTEKSGLDPQSVTNEDPVEEATPVDGSIPVEEAQPMEEKVPSDEKQPANKEENEKTPEKEASKTDKADNKAKD